MIGNEEPKELNVTKEMVVKNHLQNGPIASSSFLGQLASIMADDQVKNFFADHFSTWLDAKSALMMIQTYIAIDEEYSKRFNGKKLSSDKIVALVREMICNRDCRLLLVQAMSQYTSNNNEKFIEAYEKVALKQIESTRQENFIN